jgi:predicted esterase
MTSDFGFEYEMSEPTNPRGYTFPILYLLHDSHGSPSDILERVHKFVTPDPDLRIISLRGPVDCGDGRFTWFNRSDFTLEDYLDLIRKLGQCRFDMFRRYSPMLSATYLYAEGLGATLGLANYLGAVTPQKQSWYDVSGSRFAHTNMLVGGSLPEMLRGALNPKSFFPRCLYLAHGVRDNVTPVGDARETVRWIKDQAVPFDYREFEMGRTPSDECIADAMKWMGPIRSAIY